MTTDRAMMYATRPEGLMGDCVREWPAAYLASHIVPAGGVYPMGRDAARCVAILLGMGWAERREVTIDVPEDNGRYSMFGSVPAHRVTFASYHATDKGRAERMKPVAA